MATHTVNLANLCVFSQQQLPNEAQTDSQLLSLAQISTNSLLSSLWNLPTKKSNDASAGPMAILPTPINMNDPSITNDPDILATLQPNVDISDIFNNEVTVLIPRARKLPEEKKQTKWEKFAEEKGIDNKKRSRKVFDETAENGEGDWVARYGHGSKQNEEMNFPIMEADAKDPHANPWELKRAEKKKRVDDNNVRQGKNTEKNGGGKKGQSARTEKESKREREKGSKSNREFGEKIPAGIAVDFKNDKQRGLASTKKALAATQRSTASLGKFDQSRQHEPEKKKAITRKKFSDNMVVGNKEREKSEMKILDNVINGVGVNASNKTKNKNARGTAYDHEMSERGGGGNDGFRKKKGRAGQGKMSKVTKKSIK